jgi:DsbC/DsbD-like thiol-disulfide interchange protein
MTRTKIGFFTTAFILLFVWIMNGQTVTGSIGNGKVKRGTTASGTIRLEIPEGRHVNSNKPSSEYLIATVVKLSAKGLKVGAVKYPKGEDRTFKFTTKSLNVYEGSVLFPFKVTVPRSFKGKTMSIEAKVEFQACTDEICYPPDSESITLTATVI